MGRKRGARGEEDREGRQGEAEKRRLRERREETELWVGGHGRKSRERWGTRAQGQTEMERRTREGKKKEGAATQVTAQRQGGAPSQQVHGRQVGEGPDQEAWLPGRCCSWVACVWSQPLLQKAGFWMLWRPSPEIASGFCVGTECPGIVSRHGKEGTVTLALQVGKT